MSRPTVLLKFMGFDESGTIIPNIRTFCRAHEYKNKYSLYYFAKIVDCLRSGSHGNDETIEFARSSCFASSLLWLLLSLPASSK